MWSSEFYSDTFRNAEANARAAGMAEGKAEGKAEAVLMVLKSRGIALTEAQEARVSGCRDLAQLRIWLNRAAKVEAADQIFD